MKRTTLPTAWAVALTTAALGQTGAPPEPALVEATRWVMGTSLRIALVGTSADSLADALEAAFTEAQRWDGLLSHYDPQSPLSQVNAQAGQWVDVPEDLFRYLDRSVADGDRTNRAFDITVGGWRGAEADAKPRVGIQWLQLRGRGGHFQARLRHRGMALDPGGNGKGVALDTVAQLLQARGVHDALLDFGGSSWLALGTPPEGLTWDIEVAGLDGEVVGRMRLVDRALSVSASLSRDRAPDSGTSTERQPHIVDPRGLTWVTDDRVVVVVSPSATDAEVLSTALVVRGAEGLPMLSRFEEAGAVLLERDSEPVITEHARIWFEPD